MILKRAVCFNILILTQPGKSITCIYLYFHTLNSIFVKNLKCFNLYNLVINFDIIELGTGGLHKIEKIKVRKRNPEHALLAKHFKIPYTSSLQVSNYFVYHIF